MTQQYQQNSINNPRQPVTVTAATQVTLDDSLIVANSAGGPFAVTLPNAAQIPGNTVAIKAPSANVNNVTVNTLLGQTIDGAATFVMDSVNQSLVVRSDGANWRVTLPTAGAGVDTTAIHVDVAGEIAGIALKAAPVTADLFVIEDSADADNKKRITLGSMPVAQSQVESVVQQEAADADPVTIIGSTGSIVMTVTRAANVAIKTGAGVFAGQAVDLFALSVAGGGSYTLALDVGILTLNATSHSARVRRNAANTAWVAVLLSGATIV